MSRILECSPFDPIILDHTEPQLDFILEMYAQENPKKLKFTRTGKLEPGMENSLRKKEWSERLIGKGLADYYGEIAPMSDALKERLRQFGTPSKVTPMRQPKKPINK